MQNVISDIAPSGGDYYVDFFDWAVFSYAWQSQLGQQNFNTACELMADGVIDEYDLLIIMDEWLKFGDKPLFADIYPQPNGDGIINIYDFALFAQRWMDN
jgi:hypothetical protein